MITKEQQKNNLLTIAKHLKEKENLKKLSILSPIELYNLKGEKENMENINLCQFENLQVLEIKQNDNVIYINTNPETKEREIVSIYGYCTFDLEQEDIYYNDTYILDNIVLDKNDNEEEYITKSVYEETPFSKDNPAFILMKNKHHAIKKSLSTAFENLPNISKRDFIELMTSPNDEVFAKRNKSIENKLKK